MRPFGQGSAIFRRAMPGSRKKRTRAAVAEVNSNSPSQLWLRSNCLSASRRIFSKPVIVGYLIGQIHSGRSPHDFFSNQMRAFQTLVHGNGKWHFFLILECPTIRTSRSSGYHRKEVINLELHDRSTPNSHSESTSEQLPVIVSYSSFRPPSPPSSLSQNSP